MSPASPNVGRYGEAELLTLAPRAIATHTATQSGEWTDASTWADGSVPDDGAAVLIDDGVTVTLSSVVDTPHRTLRVDGTLGVDHSVDTRLRVDTILVSKRGRLEVGTSENPVRTGVSAEIEFLEAVPLERDRDPRLLGRGLLVAGECEVHGAPKTSWDVLDTHARAGDDQVTLSGQGPAALADHGWQVGDEVLFLDQAPYTEADLVTAAGEVVDVDHDDEIRTVTDVTGDSIALDTPLSADHVPPSADLDSYACNLSRNVHWFSAADDADAFGHVMFASPGHSIAYLQCSDLGRTARHREPVSNPLWKRGESDTARFENQRARYPIHFHRTGPEADESVVTGCAVRRTPGWAYVNHGANVDFLENVSYRAADVGFVTERGGEGGSMRRNFSCRSLGSGEEIDSRKGWRNAHPTLQADPPNNVDDFAHHGGGFWIHSPVVEVADNVAAGHRAHGFVFHFRSLYEQPLAEGESLDGKHDQFPLLAVSLLTDAEREWGKPGSEQPNVGGSWHDRGDEWYYNSTLPPRTFENNVCFASGAGCEFRSTGFRQPRPRYAWTELSGFTVYNIGQHYLEDGVPQGQFNNFQSDGQIGIDHRYVGNITHRNHRLIGTGGGIGSDTNQAYTNTWDLEDCTIEDWEYGYQPKWYSDDGYCRVTDTDFDNETDVYIASRFPTAADRLPEDTSGLVLSGNTYDGGDRLEWPEIHPSAMIPHRFVGDHCQVLWEGQPLYHGWSHPDFVIVESGDDERLSKLVNHGNRGRWASTLGVDEDEVEGILPGITHQEFYDEYGITFYGGLQDPTEPGFERPSDFGAPGDHGYARDPFLDTRENAMPAEEVWIDATRTTMQGDATLVTEPGEHLRQGVFSEATGGDLVRLESPRMHHAEGVQDDDGRLAYDLELATGGDYHLLVRCAMAGSVGRNNQCLWVRWDGGDWEFSGTIGWPGDLCWTTYMDEGYPFPTGRRHSLSAGWHTVEIAAYSDPVFVDKLLVKRDTVPTAPLWTGRPHTPHQSEL